MSFIKTVMKRYSVRNFKNTEVDNEKILKILDAARYAPSAHNNQPWHFIVVTDSEEKEQVASTFKGKWLQSAPVIIVACGDHAQSWKRWDGKDHCDIDLAIAIEHMSLAATDLNLGSCWICAFDADSCHESLNLPENLEVVALIPIGYPDKADTKGKIRKEIDEIVSWQSYGKKLD